MNRHEFCIRFANEMGISQRKAVKACVPVLNLLAKCIAEEDRVYIVGIGTFKKKIRKPHRIGDMKGGYIDLPEKEIIVFEPSDSIGRTNTIENEED